MLPQIASKAWYHGYDAFRKVPADLSEATTIGATMTLLAMITCVVLFCCETSAFLTDAPTSRIVVDSNQDELLTINFDVTMLDVDCSHLTVGVWDAFGTERFNITKNVQKQRVDHKGTRKGQPYKEEELLELEFSDRSFTAEELAELDSDWGSSSDNFKHNDFQAVVDAHDFTMINFYADWCSHCRNFAPTWFDFEKSVNEHKVTATDADGQPASVHLLRLNCVDFQDTCKEQMIRGFPAVRLYRRGAKKGEFDEYTGERNADGMTRWMQSIVAKRRLHTGATYHSIFSEGCRVAGSVNVARVPGTVHFQVGQSKERDINPAFTNVSHTVHHFSFGEVPITCQSARRTDLRGGQISQGAESFHQGGAHTVRRLGPSQLPTDPPMECANLAAGHHPPGEVLLRSLTCGGSYRQSRPQMVRLHHADLRNHWWRIHSDVPCCGSPQSIERPNKKYAGQGQLTWLFGGGALHK